MRSVHCRGLSVLFLLGLALGALLLPLLSDLGVVLFDESLAVQLHFLLRDFTVTLRKIVRTEDAKRVGLSRERGRKQRRSAKQNIWGKTSSQATIKTSARAQSNYYHQEAHLPVPLVIPLRLLLVPGQLVGRDVPPPVRYRLRHRLEEGVPPLLGLLLLVVAVALAVGRAAAGLLLVAGSRLGRVAGIVGAADDGRRRRGCSCGCCGRVCTAPFGVGGRRGYLGEPPSLPLRQDQGPLLLEEEVVRAGGWSPS